MKKRFAAILTLAGLLTFSQAALGAVKGANEDPANTEVTDETLVVCLASEPSTLWGPAEGKLERSEMM